ncbi:50S ribosomal protein L30e [Candidatus Marsarchaeota archaeon]|nr:50S ribosomal protein L30e [Candidatus Marsarchaeota archaeon]
MVDLNSDIRLATGTGKVAIGYKDTVRMINKNGLKAVILAVKGKKEIVEDITHVCSIAGVRIIRFEGNSIELGTVCGKPYSVNSIGIMEEGNSRILDESY